VGPGLPGEDPRTRTGVALLADSGGLDRGVIDAGGLEAITPQQRFGPGVVLTPHRGEADRLAERLGVDAHLPGPGLATALAARTGATVLLKGAITLVAPGDGGPLRSQDDATSQLATAGTGDVLAGVLGTLLAAGLEGPDAAALAAILHGRAGRLASLGGRLPLVALDVADHLPRALGDILADALS
ncbi:MAG: ADP-dependent NAD(P)H-hydrate dehydratase, partial [Brachybacterium tyrofermentans]